MLERKILKTKAIYSRLTIDQLVAKLATSRPKTTEEVIAKLQDMVSCPAPALDKLNDRLLLARSKRPSPTRPLPS